MNTKNLLIASSIGAVVTTFFANFPVINLVNCLICLPFWGGPLLAVWIYKRQTGSLNMTHAIYVGLLTGLFAGLRPFEFALATSTDDPLRYAIIESYSAGYNLVDLAIAMRHGAVAEGVLRQQEEVYR